MRDLKVSALSEDGEHVILVADADEPGRPVPPVDTEPSGAEEYRVRVDERLRSALRGTLGRLGQQPAAAATGQISPREIQARLRAGQAVTDIAAAAGVDPAWVARFAGPILAERDMAARRAMQMQVSADLDGTGTLDERVRAAVQAAHHDPDETTWDAFKRDDGAWVVEASLPEGFHPLRARFLFQPRSGRVTLLDEPAWLLLAPDRAGRPALRAVPADARVAPVAAASPIGPSASEALAAVFREDPPLPVPAAAPAGQPPVAPAAAQAAATSSPAAESTTPERSAALAGAADGPPSAPLGEPGAVAGAVPAAPAGRRADRARPGAAAATTATTARVGADPLRRVERKGRPSVPRWADILISTSERAADDEP